MHRILSLLESSMLSNRRRTLHSSNESSPTLSEYPVSRLLDPNPALRFNVSNLFEQHADTPQYLTSSPAFRHYMDLSKDHSIEESPKSAAESTPSNINNNNFIPKSTVSSLHDPLVSELEEYIRCFSGWKIKGERWSEVSRRGVGDEGAFDPTALTAIAIILDEVCSEVMYSWRNRAVKSNKRRRRALDEQNTTDEFADGVGGMLCPIHDNFEVARRLQALGADLSSHTAEESCSPESRRASDELERIVRNRLEVCIDTQ